MIHIQENHTNFCIFLSILFTAFDFNCLTIYKIDFKCHDDVNNISQLFRFNFMLIPTSAQFIYFHKLVESPQIKSFGARISNSTQPQTAAPHISLALSGLAAGVAAALLFISSGQQNIHFAQIKL